VQGEHDFGVCVIFPNPPFEKGVNLHACMLHLYKEITQIKGQRSEKVQIHTSKMSLGVVPFEAARLNFPTKRFSVLLCSPLRSHPQVTVYLGSSFPTPIFTLVF
jgi:hypothetical protein